MTNSTLLNGAVATSLLATGLLVLAGCSRTVAPPPSVETSAAPTGVGFLSDYSQLQRGREGQAQWVYINPRAQWSKYTKVIVDPVTFIASARTKVSPEDQQTLAAYFYNQLREQLSKKAALVGQPGPDVLRLRVALTDAESATPGLRSISVVVPQARVLNMIHSVGSGSYAFVGSASCEGEAIDSATGERLAAWIDKRVGGLALSAAAQWKWGDAESAMDYWAKKLVDRYVELKSGQPAT